jgi:N-methylhydantoinase A
MWHDAVPAEWTRREPTATRPVFFDDGAAAVAAGVYDGRQLRAGDVLAGPAVVEETTTTLVVAPGEEVRVDRFGNYRLTRVGRSGGSNGAR